MFCTTCGNEISKEVKFCTSCGSSVERSKPFVTPSGAGRYAGTRNAKRMFVWVGVFLTLAAAGVFAFFALPGIIGDSGELDSRIMSVFRVEGDTVRLSRHAEGITDARAGMGLHAGYGVATGRDSFCYILLDTDSLVKMDVSTDISVEQLTDNLLRISVGRGQILVNVQNQSPEHVLEAIIGNTVISVRGTLFVAGVYAGGEAIITVLDGSVNVNNVPLFAGYTMRVFDGIEMNHEISPIDFGRADEFLFNAAADNLDRLLTAEFLYDIDIDEETLIAGYVVEDVTDDEEHGNDVTFEEVRPIAVGEIIRFDSYDWRILDIQGNQALIITDRIIMHSTYHHASEAVTWEASEIRQWLNSEFFASFSPADRARIVETYVVNDDNPWDFVEWGGHHNTPAGNNTRDRIFLLSIDEALRYFGDSGLVAIGSTMGTNERDASAYGGLQGWAIYDQYNGARRAWDLEGSDYWWWLRSPGFLPDYAAIVYNNGRLLLGGYNVFWFAGGVRPALWLSLPE